MQPVTEARWDSYERRGFSGCLEGTRTDLIEQIHQWVLGGDKNVFWLNGIAGTGKSAIAHTIAQHYAQSGSLGGSFFFSRDTESRSTQRFLVQTLADSLVSTFPALGSEMAKVLKDKSTLNKKLVDQLKLLIVEPVSKLGNTCPIIFVIDALDECKEPAAAQDLIHALAEVFSPDLEDQRVISLLRFFVTSRPEKHIKGEMSEQHADTIALHDIEEKQVRDDIGAYLLSETRRIAKQCCMDNTWPSNDQLFALRDRAGSLFIAATTMIKYVDSFFDPNEGLNSLLDETSTPIDNNPYQALDKIYTVVLDGVVGPAARRQAKNVLCLVLLSLNPLSLHDMANLLSLRPISLRNLLEKLQSILIVPSDNDQPVRSAHASLHDFITRRCTSEYHVTHQDGNVYLAQLCLEFMLTTDKLRQNYFELEDTMTTYEQMKGNPIPNYIAYTIKNWPKHIISCEHPKPLVEKICAFLDAKVLPWLELLAWSHSLLTARDSLVEMGETLTLHMDSTPKLQEMMVDILHFMEFGAKTICSRPAEIYNVVQFCPPGSWIHKVYQTKVTKFDVLTHNLWQWPKHHADEKVVWHISQVCSLAVCPRTDNVVAGYQDGSIYLWNTETTKLDKSFVGHQESVQSLALTSDGKHLVSGSWDQNVCIWDVHTSKAIHVLLQKAPVYAVCISLNDKLIAIASKAVIVLWSFDSKGAIETLEGHTDTVHCLSFSSDHTQLVSASLDWTVCLWDINNGQAHLSIACSGPCVSVIMSQDGKHIITGLRLAEHNIQVRTKEGECIQTLSEHTNTVFCLAISPDGNLLASASADCSVKIWDIETWTPKQTFVEDADYVSSVAFMSFGKHIVSGFHDGSVRMWELTEGDSGDNEGNLGDKLRCVEVSEDGMFVCTGSESGVVQIWDTTTNQTIISSTVHSACVNSVSFSHDCKTLASGSYDCTLKLWDLGKLAVIHDFRDHDGGVFGTAISMDGLLVASASADKATMIWDVKTGQLRHKIGHSDEVNCVAFSPDGKFVGTGSDDCVVRVWDTTTGQIQHEFGDHQSSITHIAFSNDNLCVIACSISSELITWDHSTGMRMLTVNDTKLLPKALKAIYLAYLPVSKRLQLLKKADINTPEGYVYFYDHRNGCLWGRPNTLKGHFEAVMGIQGGCQPTYWANVAFSCNSTLR